MPLLQTDRSRSMQPDPVRERVVSADPGAKTLLPALSMDALQAFLSTPVMAGAAHAQAARGRYEKSKPLQLPTLTEEQLQSENKYIVLRVRWLGEVVLVTC
jgi:hypothetical protein